MALLPGVMRTARLLEYAGSSVPVFQPAPVTCAVISAPVLSTYCASVKLSGGSSAGPSGPRDCCAIAPWPKRTQAATAAISLTCIPSPVPIGQNLAGTGPASKDRNSLSCAEHPVTRIP